MYDCILSICFIKEMMMMSLISMHYRYHRCKKASNVLVMEQK